MDTIDVINQHLQNLPASFHPEVLDFIDYLLTKSKNETYREEIQDWSDFSLRSAMKGMEEEDSPMYTVDDLKNGN